MTSYDIVMFPNNITSRFSQKRLSGWLRNLATVSFSSFRGSTWASKGRGKGWSHDNILMPLKLPNWKITKTLCGYILTGPHVVTPHVTFHHGGNPPSACSTIDSWTLSDMMFLEHGLSLNKPMGCISLNWLLKIFVGRKITFSWSPFPFKMEFVVSLNGIISFHETCSHHDHHHHHHHHLAWC